AKTINGEVQLHALVDGKKIIITESIVRRDLQLEDAEGIDCLPNYTIFEELTRMGSKTTAWNEFCSTMASAIICLETNQKFNFSKYIFKSMVKNLDNVFGKFLMYPRFVQVFVNQQLDGLPTHKKIYDAPSHTKKIFGNMKRVGKGFYGRVTPLFPSMVVQNQTELDKVVYKELGDSLVRAATTASSLKAEHDSGNITKTQSKATPNESSSLGTTSSGCPRRQETMGDTIAQTRFENVSKLSNDPLLAREQEVAAKDVNLTIDEVTLAQAFTALKSVKPKVKGVVIQEPSTTTTIISSQQPSQEKGKGIMVEEPVKTMKKKDLIRLDEEERLAREKDEASIALIEEWDNIQAKIEADHELA
ncbi:hypothetical protein Tco_1497830, partial [Tanacetum coccineum]